MLDRSLIVARLREIASLLELHGGNKFKARAFARGARTLEASREPIDKLIEEKRLTDLPGIGFALAKQIEELSLKGTSEVLSTLREGLPSGVLELSQVIGIGLHALRTLSNELGIQSLGDLRRAAEEGRLRKVKGFGEKKEAKILEAIAKYETKGPEILLADGLRLGESLVEDLAALEGVSRAELAGSLRRYVEVSRDLDIVLTAKDPRAAIEAAQRHPRFSSVEKGKQQEREEREEEASCRLRLPDGTRVDLIACTDENHGAVLVKATGTKAHLSKIQERARTHGLELRENGVFTNAGERVPLAEERDLYARLGLTWIPPELRDGTNGEIEEAALGRIELVTMNDIRGFVHCHSTWSDGRHSIEAMARAAEERGADFITITDHSKTAHYAGGLDVDRIQKQWDEIDEVQERVGIRILKGTESDILADGALDWPDHVLERLDVIIASIHSRYKQGEDAMTQRLLRAMRAPVFKIWGHPLGRLVTSRPPIPCRVEEVLDALAESASDGFGGAIEINGDPKRLDLEPRWSRLARERGLPFVLSVDAHSISNLDYLRYAVGLGRRAGLRRNDVLNTRDARMFARLVRPVPVRYSHGDGNKNHRESGDRRAQRPRRARVHAARLG